MEEGIWRKRSLLFALVHNSILEEREFVFINNLVQNIGVDKMNLDYLNKFDIDEEK